MPPPNPPAEVAATTALSARRVLAPATVWSPVLAWETQPGATFVAGSRLGTLRSESATGAFAATADCLCLLVFLLTCGLFRLGCLVGERVLTAPEDGVLLWLLPFASARRLRRGEPLAAYFPLREWQAYERLGGVLRGAKRKTHCRETGGNLGGFWAVLGVLRGRRIVYVYGMDISPPKNNTCHSPLLLFSTLLIVYVYGMMVTIKDAGAGHLRPHAHRSINYSPNAPQLLLDREIGA